MKPIPRIQAKLGTATEGQHKGKFFFEVFLSFIGDGNPPKSLGTFGPFRSQEIAETAMQEVCKTACDSLEENLNGKVSGKYVDMKTNQIKEWPKDPAQVLPFRLKHQ